MKLSVVIPAFNASSTIEETVKAICNPIYYFIDEVIIYNDGSTDNTLSIIKKLKSKFLKIKYFSSTKNKGGGFARNFGIKKCKNQLIMVLDADELIHETSLQKIYKHALKNNHTAHYETAKYFNKNHNKIDSHLNYSKVYGKNFTYNKFIKNHISPVNFIFTKIRKFKIKIELADKCFANSIKYISGRKKRADSELAISTTIKVGNNLFILLE